MAATIPTQEPTEFISGETVKWTKSLSDYPASTWTLTYDFVNASASFDATVTASGDDYSVVIPESAAPSSGVYWWQAWVESGSEKYVVDSGSVEVKPKLSAGTAQDVRSFARKALAEIEAALLLRVESGHLSMSIGGRSVSWESPGELYALRDKFRSEVRREDNAERIANGMGNPNKIRFRF